MAGRVLLSLYAVSRAEVAVVSVIVRVGFAQFLLGCQEFRFCGIDDSTEPLVFSHNLLELGVVALSLLFFTLAAQTGIFAVFEELVAGCWEHESHVEEVLLVDHCQVDGEVSERHYVVSWELVGVCHSLRSLGN